MNQITQNPFGIVKENYMDEFVMKLSKDGGDIIFSFLENSRYYTDLEIDQEDCDKMHLLHMCVGMQGEAVELLENLDGRNPEASSELEELGDLLFYTVGASKVLLPEYIVWHTYFNTINIPEPNSSVHVLCAINEVADHIKKLVIYNKLEARQNLLADLENAILPKAFGELAMCANILGYSLQDIIDHNVIKLEKRYRNLVYSDAAAMQRADKKAEPEVDMTTAEGCRESDYRPAPSLIDTSNVFPNDDYDPNNDYQNTVENKLLD